MDADPIQHEPLLDRQSTESPQMCHSPAESGFVPHSPADLQHELPADIDEEIHLPVHIEPPVTAAAAAAADGAPTAANLSSNLKKRAAGSEKVFQAHHMKSAHLAYGWLCSHRRQRR
jgi:hypothetical protein